MTLLQEYLSLTRQYKEQYGENTIVLMQVGAFFEVYAILNKEDNNVKQNIMEIQPYNSSDKTIICGSFDYQNFNYSDLYAPTNGSELEESFKLLSCNIPSKYENNLSLDERIKEYEKNTKHFANMITNEN